MKLTCGACANAGAAEPLTPERVLCPLAQVPMLRGQQCGYAIADLQRERVRALNLALNKIAGDRDTDKLRALLRVMGVDDPFEGRRYDWQFELVDPVGSVMREAVK